MRTKPFVMIMLPLLLTACTQCSVNVAPPKTISLVSYNLMTLFDPVDHGGEYEGYSVAEGTWDEGRYRTRVANAAAAIRGLVPKGPDILVAIEAENPRVLRDLAEKLGGYGAILSSPDERAALGCGILSRFPVISARAHLDETPQSPAGQIPRYMIEANLNVDGKSLIVLAVHWKSKLGGARETENARRCAAELAKRIIVERLREDPSRAIVLAGDLNENPDEFELVEREYPTALMPEDQGEGQWLCITGTQVNASWSAGELVLYDPWEDFEGYSYKYEGNEERIDHVLLSPGLFSGGSLRFSSFNAVPPSFLTDDQGVPLRWDTHTGAGYSDHLPICLYLNVE